MNDKIEQLLQSPYYIIDILPMQVPENSPGQYFAVEEYYLKDKQFEKIKRKHINLVLKLNCYRDISIDEEAVINPSPKHTKKISLYYAWRIHDSLRAGRYAYDGL